MLGQRSCSESDCRAGPLSGRAPNLRRKCATDRSVLAGDVSGGYSVLRAAVGWVTEVVV